jgi:hypothetical protein
MTDEKRQRKRTPLLGMCADIPGYGTEAFLREKRQEIEIEEAKLRRAETRMDNITIAVNPPISAEQLYAFYEKNGICEAGYRKDVAARVLEHSSLVVAALIGDELVAVARAMFDGLDAQIMELSLDLRYQGNGLQYENGSLIESDPTAFGKKMGEVVIRELLSMGAFFISALALQDCEDGFYESLGFRLNKGHVNYVIDRRPYVVDEGQADS